MAHLSRGCQQRVRRREAITANVNESIRCLNWCSGFGFASPSREVLPQRLTGEVQDFVRSLYSEAAPAADAMCPQEAVRALLGQGPAYGDAGGVPEHLGVYDYNLVSLPKAGRPVPLVDLLALGSDEWQTLMDEQRLLLSPDEFGTVLESEGCVRPYSDPILNLGSIVGS